MSSISNHLVRPQIRTLAVAASTFLLAVPACAGQAAPAPKTITIGVDLPLTGDEGRAGVSTLNGIRYFVQTHPTLDGFTIVLDARDDANSGPRDPSRGVKNIKAFIANPHIIAMLGLFDSSIARAQIPLAHQAHLAMGIPAQDAGLPTPSDHRPTGVTNYFRLSTTDELQGPAAADYARKQLHLMRVAVVNHHEAYGQLLANSFTARFNRLGGTVVARTELDPGVTFDLTTFLQQAKSKGAQGVYFGGSAANQGCTVRHQMISVFDIGAGAPFLGGDGIALDPTCVRDAGANAADIYATVPALDPEQITSAQDLIKAFKTQYGRVGDLGPYTIAAYDATGVLYDALHRAILAAGGNIPFRDTVVNQLAATTAYTGATGVFGFDPDGDTTLRMVSIFQPVGPDPHAGWKWVDTISYTAALPY